MPLSETDLRDILTRYFSAFVIGSQGRVEVERSVIRGTEIDFKVIVISEQTIRPLSITFFRIRSVVEEKIDLLKPDHNERVIYIKQPVGGKSVNIKDLIEYIVREKNTIK
ncbi:hypothetical protein [Bacillus safensis]|uniref:hypothetical protein n=1 Tax=Bacillus safensis TaxID=561879 RepID=UPI003C2298DB